MSPAGLVLLVTVVLLGNFVGFAQADYNVVSAGLTPAGMLLDLALTKPGPYGGDITSPIVEVTYVSANILRVRIYDSQAARWEVPDVVRIKMPRFAPKKLNYKFSYTSYPFGFAVQRDGASGETLFNTSGNPFTFEDRFLSISTQLPRDPAIYGLGERVESFRLPYQGGKTYTIWARDAGTPVFNNLYGAHPYYMEMRPGGRAHGVFLLNANAMDVVLQEGLLTYKTTGGILDFFFVVGPTPEGATRQYHEVVGKPHMPPYWSLGFHQCRWGYKTLNETMQVVANYSKNLLPLDTMWNDIDYMDAYKDFTTDPVNFPTSQMAAFVSQLHANGQRYVLMTDPGIKIEPGYAPYEQGLKDDIFVKDKNGNPYVGKVWPGLTHFPDFTHPKALSYWHQQLDNFRASSGINFDGVWIDMNEIANFCDGECTSVRALNNTGDFDPNNPPYKPWNGGAPLYSHTISLDATQYAAGVFDLHSLYGHTEAMATKKSLEAYNHKRSLVITRSSFAGTGHFTGHWLGDNTSEWPDLYYSIPGVMSMQLFGIPLVGADICGFSGATTPELCTRWMQVGTLYPFSRNHNAINQPSQEPYQFGATMTVINRESLNLRYSLLPYMYTMFFHVHKEGGTIWRPLFFEFPTEGGKLLDIDQQFLIGPYLMVTPVLTQGATTVSAYFPGGPKQLWYQFSPQNSPTFGAQIAGGQTATLNAPLAVGSTIPIHIRGGGIVPMQGVALNTMLARQQPFGLVVALSSTGTASGDLFVDDGESIDSIKNSHYSYIRFTASNGNTLQVQPSSLNNLDFLKPISWINVFGVSSISKITINDTPLSNTFWNVENNVLKIQNVLIPMNSTQTVQWA